MSRRFEIKLTSKGLTLATKMSDALTGEVTYCPYQQSNKIGIRVDNDKLFVPVKKIFALGGFNPKEV